MLLYQYLEDEVKSQENQGHPQLHIEFELEASLSLPDNVS